MSTLDWSQDLVLDQPELDHTHEEFVDLLNRFGIALIADQIEAENQVVDLLDYELRFGQGPLFSPPRPVRAEALQSERAEAIARDAASSDKSRDKPQSLAAL